MPSAAAFVGMLASIVAIVNPVGNLVTFHTLTAGFTREDRARVVRRIVTVGPAVLVVFGLAGKPIFDVFSITLPAFQIAGGILIFSIAFEMLRGERSRMRATDAEVQDAMDRASVGITPLAIPLYSGPGAITTVMIFVAQSGDIVDIALVFVAVALTFALAFVILREGTRIFDRLGRSGLLVFQRIMGLILAAVAVQFVLDGITAAGVA